MTTPKPTPHATTEMLLLPGGQILVHNLTPTMAALLAELNPADEPMRVRAGPAAPSRPPAQLPNRRDGAIG